MNNNQNPSDKRKWYRRILSVCLIMAMVNSSILPHFEHIGQVQAEEIDPEEVDAVDAVPEDETPENDNLQEQSEVQPQEAQESQKPQETTADQEQVQPANVLQADNTAQREEQKEKQKADAQQKISPELSVTLTAQTDFPENAVGKINVLEGEGLDNLKKSLNLYLEKDKQELLEVHLPMEIGFVNEAGEEQEKKEQVTVTVTPGEEELYQQLKALNQEEKLLLYHQKKTEEGNEWEKLDYQFYDKTEDAPAYIEFKTESMSPFLFVETTEKKEEEKKEEKIEAPKPQKTPSGTAAEGTASVASEDKVSVEQFNAVFSDGATKNSSGQWVWNPTESASGHLFVYNLSYSVSGIVSDEPGALRFELPLHILKDRDGNGADTFECPYILKSEVQEGDDIDFVYEIDEANNKIIISNYKKITTTAGYIEVGYSTAKSTLDYKDMESSENMTASIQVKGTNGTSDEKTATGDPVYIDTHATIAWTQKMPNPSYYSEWQSGWGDKPADAEQYYYLVWEIRSSVNEITSPYTFQLDDTFTDLSGDAVRYKFSGQSTFTEKNTSENNRWDGTRYDYVLTRYSKTQADGKLETDKKYTLSNKIKATVTATDGMDAKTTADASQTWTYKIQEKNDPGYKIPIAALYLEKYGIYGQDSRVYSSQDISDYTLEELVSKTKESIDPLKFSMSMTGYSYPYTLENGEGPGTEADALAGHYGKKKVSYKLVDDTLSLEGTSLKDEDYDILGIQWSAKMRTATYNEDKKSFTETAIQNYKDEDKITIEVRTGTKDGANAWKKAAVYSMKTGSYESTESTLVTDSSGGNLTFAAGVKGVRLSCENAYYYTTLNMDLSVSLKRTANVLGIIGDKAKIELNNQAESTMQQGDRIIFQKTRSGSDYIQKVIPTSEMRKDVTQTKNDKRKKRYLINWRLKAQECYTDNEGVHYLRQDAGTFYDLLPEGAALTRNSVEVQASGSKLNDGNYNITLKENYNNTGRTLVTIQIKEPTTTGYQVSYQTSHDYDAIQDHGKNLLNSAAYETGNAKIASGSPDDGGSITEKNLMAGLNAASSGNKFLYAEARHHINILMAGNNGLKKQVKNEKDDEYRSESYVNQGGNYSYRIRVANNKVTRCKNLIFYDSLESYYNSSEQTTEVKVSDWKGTLTGIDVSTLRENGIQPVIYLSTVDRMNLNQHHDLTEKQEDGTLLWIEYNEFLKTHKLEDVHAVAVDASKKTDGSEFILEGQKSLSFTLYMKAPESDSIGKQDPTTYNNIYMQQNFLHGEDATSTGIPQFLHQDYTSLHYRVTGDIRLKKVDETDDTIPASGATYLLRGTSDYGTTYETTKVSDRKGEFSFTEIEKGTYELLETACTNDWMLNTTVYTVKIDGNGTVTMEGQSQDANGQFLVKDAPRIHGDLHFKKIDSITENPINDVEFLLTGTSDYGNDVFQQAASEGKEAEKYDAGEVTFNNLELGTYKLSETKTKDGYILSRTEWTVQVNESGMVILRNPDGSEVKRDTDSTYMITNEPLHSIRFIKTSTYGKNITLTGAEFSLTGISDYGTNTDKTGVSGNDGIVTIDGLEPGTYQLKETKAPENYELNTTIYTVIVKSDGDFTIDGLQKVTMGKAQIYEFKNIPTGGVVKLTKIWKDSKTNAQRKIPDMTISTKKPSKDLRGYTITFDANGGTFAGGATTNEMVYSTDGTKVDGTYYKPTNGDSSFRGWYTKAKDGTEYEVDESGKPATTLTEDITVYAHYLPPMKYAVAIYGICVDQLESGEAGLTFGPALGENYVQSFKSHEPGGITTLGNEHRCVHNDDWNKIIEWNKKDPYVYEQCIKEGCTHSVVLSKNTTTTILEEKFNSIKETGDGPSTLYYELVTENQNGACFENLRWHPNGGTEGTNTDGWGATRIRAMLNGADDLTDKGENNYSKYASSDVNKSANIYTPYNCLFATFPQELQAAIGKRKVKYDSVNNQKNEDNLKTTNDKLWLFSSNEVADMISYSVYNHPLEGSVYKKFKYTFDSVEHERRPYRLYSTSTGNTYGAMFGAWLRSSHESLNQKALTLNNGALSYSNAYSTYGVSVGFTLER